MMKKSTLRLLFSDPEGFIFEHPFLESAVWDGQNWIRPDLKQLIPLPAGSRLFTLPQRFPICYNPEVDKFFPLTRFYVDYGDFEPCAMAAFLPPGYMRLALPAYSRSTNAPYLTQWAYTAVLSKNDTIYTTAVRVDASDRWEPGKFDDRKLISKVKSRLNAEKDNRLLEHIAHCATNYHCFAAKNFFLGRWEAPLPVARKCNASCLGCLSLQTGETPSSHQRISFTPTVEEIASLAVSHLENGLDPMVSFGQGCEGEPLTDWELMVEAIKLIRQRTSKGTIHLNTNGSIPSAVPQLAQAGLNSVRVSLNSARKENYLRYFRPEGYRFEDVIYFIKTAKQNGLFVHINLLIMPGFNDMEPEIDAFIKFVKETGADLVQLKNLNIDPEFYLQAMFLDSPTLGMMKMVEILKKQIPGLRFGYFNLQKERFTKSSEK